MSKKQLIFKIIESNPTIPNINDYIFIIIGTDTKFKEYIDFSKNNEIIDKTNLNKSLKYIIKLTKKNKVLGVGNLIMNQDIFTKKIKRKIYNNINLFITEIDYKKIFPKANINKIREGIILSLEVNIKYDNNEKELKEKPKISSSQKKIKLIKRNFSFQKNEYSVKSTNNYLTTSTSHINTHNNKNNCYDSENNITDNNLNCFSSDKIKSIAPAFVLSPHKYKAPFSEPNLKKKIKKKIKKGIISSISFKYNNRKNKKLKIFSNSLKYNINELKNKMKLTSSRNKKFLFNKNKLNEIMTQESSSSKTSNTLSNSSVINSILIDNNNYNIINNNNEIKNKNLNINVNNDTFIYNNFNKYNRDNDEIDNLLIELENKKNKILKAQEKINNIFFNQEETFNSLKNTLNNYEYKNQNNKFIINKFKEKNELLKFKKKVICNNNKEIIPLISKIKESKEIENNIINLILKNKGNNEVLKNNNIIENNIQKYNKNLMIKVIKNIIQNNQNIDIYLNEENKNKLKYICNKYNIFGTIIEENEE